MSREPSPADEIGLDLQADPEDEELNSDEEEPQGVEDGEFDDEEDPEEYETQDPADLDEAIQSESEGAGRLLDRGEQLRMEEGDDALLNETQLPEGTQEQDSQMQDDAEPLASEKSKEKRGRGRPPGKSTNKGMSEGANKKAPVQVSADNPLGRQVGKSLLPMARVTKIIKADKVRFPLSLTPARHFILRISRTSRSSRKTLCSSYHLRLKSSFGGWSLRHRMWRIGRTGRR